LMLFSLGGLLSIYEGAHKFADRAPLVSPSVAIAILLFSFAAEGSSLAVALRRAKALRRDKPLWRWLIDTRHSELLVVLGEDSAALAGLGIATVAVLATMATNDPAYDAVGSILIGALLVVVAVALAYEIKGLLIGQSAYPDVRAAIARHLRDRTDVARVADLITLQQGADIFVAARIELRHADSLRDAAAVVDDCKGALRSAFPAIAWLYIEAGPPSGPEA
jgi:divalent metal cation (Fe/Co/Zn/Cd) transporter